MHGGLIDMGPKEMTTAGSFYIFLDKETITLLHLGTN